MDQFGFQATEAPETKPSAVESPVTLLIKHLPEAIPHETLSRLLSHFGASSVRPCSSGRLRNCAFVDFKNDMLASQAHRQLNGLRFLSKVLSVERAGNPTENSEQSSGSQPGKDSKSSVVKNATISKPLNDNSKSRVPPSEPIAARLGVDYPFPPHLEYAYPPPDGNILTNIVNALIAVPRFYTQVLHLMNKMNIPAPFRMALPTPPLPAQVPAPPPPPPPPPSITMKPETANLSSSESEMDSSDDEVDGKVGSTGVARVAKSGRKRARYETIIGPAIDKDVAHEAVGVKPATLVPKEIPVIKKNSILQIKFAPKAIQSEHKDGNSMEELVEPEKETLDPKEFLTPEELESGKLPPEEILSLPMFKNYTAGNPAPVLYIKNLAKDVIVDDFYFIFGSLFGSVEAARSTLQVKLMQEGRMRGQAFLTFPSIELAQHALNLVNGFLFKGKPMIIQFGRNIAAAKGT
ncbi:hypothetical protein K1719_008491 [Acacia pycnantha]|nr:hypothetical protein K1719_008491 [Acacia pycnantha]